MGARWNCGTRSVLTQSLMLRDAHSRLGFINVVERLMELGLSSYEASAYLSLLRKSGSSPVEVASRARIPKQRVYDVLSSLLSKGFCSVVESTPRVFFATDPSIAFTRLREVEAEEFRRRETLLRAESQRLAEKLMPVFEKGLSSTAQDPVVEVITHDERLGTRLLELARQSSKSLDIVLSADSPHGSELNTLLLSLAMKNSLKCKVILESRFATNGQVRSWTEALSKHGGQVRWIGKLPIELSIFDESNAVIAIRDESEQHASTAVVVHHRHTVEFLKYAFDQLWIGAQSIQKK